MQDWPGQVRSVFPVSTDNRCKLHFDWMITETGPFSAMSTNKNVRYLRVRRDV